MVPAALFAAAFAYFGFLSAGLPFWDDDYGRWLGPSIRTPWRIVLTSLVSPVASSANDWGFLDRPWEIFCFKAAYALAGIDATALYLFKSLVASSVVLLLYLGLLHLTRDARASLGAAIFYATLPALGAAHVWLSDFGTLSQLLLVANALLWRRQIDRLASSGEIVSRRWILETSVTTVLTYVSFKCKADLKLLPLILTVSVGLTERRKLVVLGPWIAFMLFVAIPWSADPFAQLPPFIPGGPVSTTDWVWRLPSLAHLGELLGTPVQLVVGVPWTRPRIAILASFGPFLFLATALVVLLLRRRPALSSIPAAPLPSTPGATAMLVTWLLVMMMAASSLAPLSAFFRIRYGIVLLTPLVLLIAVLAARTLRSTRLPRSASAVLVVGLLAQVMLNAARSIVYRAEFGHMTIAVDQAYRAIEELGSNQKLALLGGFRAYAPPPGASAILMNPDPVANLAEIQSHPERFPVGSTLVLTWQPVEAASLAPVGSYAGTNGSLFDALIPCGDRVRKAHLYRFVGDRTNGPEDSFGRR